MTGQSIILGLIQGLTEFFPHFFFCSSYSSSPDIQSGRTKPVV